MTRALKGQRMSAEKVRITGAGGLIGAGAESRNWFRIGDPCPRCGKAPRRFTYIKRPDGMICIDCDRKGRTEPTEVS